MSVFRVDVPAMVGILIACDIPSSHPDCHHVSTRSRSLPLVLPADGMLKTESQQMLYFTNRRIVQDIVYLADLGLQSGVIQLGFCTDPDNTNAKPFLTVAFSKDTEDADDKEFNSSSNNNNNNNNNNMTVIIIIIIIIIIMIKMR